MSVVPKTIGKYEVLKLLGRGAMGIVYLGRDPAIERMVAIKTIANLGNDVGNRKEVLQRFINEARSAGRLRHPNIITIFDASVESNIAYIVMDYVQGKGLDEVLKEQGHIHPQNTLFYLKQLSSALDLAKEKGVLHRDLKPSNMMVDSQEQIYLLDFGVASLSDQLVNSKTVVGTPAYMSPEQILNEPLDHRSDLFSFGIVAFQFFTGKRPFPGDNYQAVLYNIVNSEPLKAVDYADVPQAVDDVFAKVLAKHRDDRYSSASEFFKELLKSFRLHRIEKPRGVPQSNWREHVEEKIIEPEKANDFSENVNNMSRLGSSVVRTQDENSFLKKFIIVVIILSILVIGFGVYKHNSNKQKNIVDIKDNFGSSDYKVKLSESQSTQFSAMSDKELTDFMFSNEDPSKLVEGLESVSQRNKFNVVDLAQKLVKQDSYLVKSKLIEVIVKTKTIAASSIIADLINDYDPVVRRKAVKACVDLELKENLEKIRLRKERELNNEVLKVIDIAIIRLQ